MINRSGFTLIEILVVVAIIGILAGVVQFAFSGGGNRQALASTSEAAAQRIELARSQALQSNREWGVLVLQDGYQFLEFVPEEGHWQIASNPALKPVAMPSGISLELESDGFDNKALAGELMAKDEASEAASVQDNLAHDPADELLPDILLLSSGEVTPFKLRFVPTGDGASWIVSTDGLQRALAQLEDLEE